MDLLRDLGQAAVLILTHNAWLLQYVTSGSFIEKLLKGNYAPHACSVTWRIQDARRSKAFTANSLLCVSGSIYQGHAQFSYVCCASKHFFS